MYVYVNVNVWYLLCVLDVADGITSMTSPQELAGGAEFVCPLRLPGDIARGDEAETKTGMFVMWQKEGLGNFPKKNMFLMVFGLVQVLSKGRFFLRFVPDVFLKQLQHGSTIVINAPKDVILLRKKPKTNPTKYVPNPNGWLDQNETNIWLVVWNIFYFSIMYGIILPID